jgi:hypothetical protein
VLVIGEKTIDGKVRFQQSSLKLNLAAEQLDALRQDGIPYRLGLRPAQDVLTLRIIVRDAGNGKIGSVDVPVTR